MTSANLPGRPMCTDERAIREQLGGVVGAALVHDREIVAPCDHSVVRFAGGGRRFLRRSRGWVPEPIDAPVADAPPVLALGAEFDAAVAVTQGDAVVTSQYLGEVGPETVAYLREAVGHLLDLIGVEPAAIAWDVHPQFLTTDVARDLAADGLAGPVRVQHHHAHGASLLAEHGRDRAVVVAADGTGYGPAGTIRGGEVLDARLETYEHAGGLSTFRLPGGTAAIERPGRILASLLDGREDVAERVVAADGVESRADAEAVCRQCRRGVNAPESTSAGRLLAAASALLGVCERRRYEGEPAMRLEAAAARGDAAGVRAADGHRGRTPSPRHQSTRG